MLGLGGEACQLDGEAADVDTIAGGVTLVSGVGALEEIGDKTRIVGRRVNAGIRTGDACLCAEQSAHRAAVWTILSSAACGLEFKLIEKHVDTDRKMLLGPKNTCQECHRSLRQGASRIPAADIPQIWYKRAKFDHVAHAAVGCRECHTRVDESTTNADVLLPGVDLCARCHAPAGAEEHEMRSQLEEARLRREAEKVRQQQLASERT